MSEIPKIPPETKEDAWLLFCHHISEKEISEILEINFNTLRQWVMKGKWPSRREKIEATMKQLRPPDERPIVKAIARSRVDAKKIYEEKSGAMAADDIEYWADKMDPETRLAAAPNIKALNEAHRKNLGFEEESQSERGHISLNFLTNADTMVKLISPAKVKELPDAPPTDEQ